MAAAVGLIVCAACVRLSVWSGREVRFLYGDFFKGRFDGEREWRGSYLAVCRGQLCFESERVRYAAPPATRPANRWAAEDAVGLRTPALRSFPFDGPLGFEYDHFYSVSPAGSLHVLRLAFPLWAALLASSLLVLCAFVRWGR
jgi:hypothetical protein